MEAAHELKGGASNLGFYEMMNVCGEAESLQNATKEERLEILVKIKNICEKAQTLIENKEY